MSSATLLCIDDSSQVSEHSKATLESYGYRVEFASGGDAAIKMLREASVAAVLREYKPDGVGAEGVACHIKRWFPNLPIILLSVYSEIPERILWLVDEYAMKSELPDGLARIVQRTTRSPKKEANEDAA